MFNAEIRVKIEKKFSVLYNDLKDKAFMEMHDVFFFCFAVGIKNKKKQPLSKQAEQKFHAHTFEDYEKVIFISSWLNEYNYDPSKISDINNSQSIITFAEEYANGGMYYLIDTELKQYLIKKSINDEPQLDNSASKEIAKVLAGFIYQESI